MLQANTRRQSKRTLKTESVQVMSCLDCSLGIHSPSSTTCVAESDISETSTSFVIELGKNETEKLGAIKRYRDLEKWMWKEFFSSSSLAASNYGRKRRKQLLEFCDYCYGSYSSKDGHCPCHRTSSNSESSITFAKRVTQCREKLKVDQHCTLDGLSSFPMRIRLLKMLLALTEVNMNWTFNLMLLYCKDHSCISQCLMCLFRSPFRQKLFNTFRWRGVENLGAQS